MRGVSALREGANQGKKGKKGHPFCLLVDATDEALKLAQQLISDGIIP